MTLRKSTTFGALWAAAAASVGLVSAECSDFIEVLVNARYESQVWEEPHNSASGLFKDLYVTPCSKISFSYGSNHVRVCVVARAARPDDVGRMRMARD